MQILIWVVGLAFVACFGAVVFVPLLIAALVVGVVVAFGWVLLVSAGAAMDRRAAARAHEARLAEIRRIGDQARRNMAAIADQARR